MGYMRRNLLPLALTVVVTAVIVGVGAVAIDRTFISDHGNANTSSSDLAALGPFAQALQGLNGAVLGVTVDNQLTVTGVAPGSPAAAAGIQVGDRIVSVDGKQVSSLADVRQALSDVAGGATYDVTVQRNGQQVTVQATKTALALRLRQFLQQFGDEGPRGDFGRSAPQGAPLLPGRSSPQSQPSPVPVPRAQPGTLGVNVVQVSDGIQIVAVAPGSPAAAAGIQVGDVVTMANGAPVRSIAELQSAVTSTASGNGQLRLQVLRNGQTLEVAANLGVAVQVQPAPPVPSTPSAPASGVDDATLQRLADALIPLLEARGYTAQTATPQPSPALADPGALRVYSGTVEALTDTSIRLTGAGGGITFRVTSSTVFVGVQQAGVGHAVTVAADADGVALLVLTIGQ